VSLFLLATGTLTADPRRRTSASAKEFATALLRVPAEDDPVLVSLIAFDLDACASLLNLRKGDSCSVTGWAKLTDWTGTDGHQFCQAAISISNISSITTLISSMFTFALSWQAP
jgi:hypothetical protein